MKRHLFLSIHPVFFVATAGLLGLSRPAVAQEAPTKADTQPAIDLYEFLAGPDVSDAQRETRRHLESVLEAAREPLDQATAHAALANWLLTVPTARPATRWLLGLDRPEDRQALTESVAVARKHLFKAERLLKDGKADAGGEKAHRRRLSTGVNTLKAFAEVFLAAGSQAGGDGRQEAWSEAATALSEARESDNAQVASAATLWQAMAWLQADRQRRALGVLPEALAKPEAEYDFMSRILRCRILMLQGQYTAALALTTQMRSRIGDWFPRERTIRHHARERLIGAVQLQVGQAWTKKLLAGTQPADAEILGGILADVRQKLFPPGDTDVEVYVLEEAVPILVKPPAVKPLPTAPVDQPDTNPE